MKRTALILGVVATAFLLSGCDDNTNPVYNSEPAAPQGVYSITGDEAVEVVWNGVYERDIDSYIIYRSFQATTGYTEIGQVSAFSNPDLDLIVYNFIDNSVHNGVTYYYAVSAVDRAGQESPLSAEEVFDTPRPEGQLALYIFYANYNMSALILSATPTITAPINPDADIYIDSMWGAFYISVVNNVTTRIQDVGYTENFSEIGYSPAGGWTSNGYLELIPGHTYVIRTSDNHYAKLRVLGQNMNTGYVSFQWAYQTDTGNPELAPSLPGGGTPQPGSEPLTQSTNSADGM